MYLDAEVNKKPTVVRSLYQACLMAAFRFHAIVRHVLTRHCHGKVALDVHFLAHSVIKEFCARMLSHIRLVRSRKNIRVSLLQWETAWLCYEAFIRKLTRHDPFYASLVSIVEEFRNEAADKLPSAQLAKLRLWIGSRGRIPRSFRRMKDRRFV